MLVQEQTPERELTAQAATVDSSQAQAPADVGAKPSAPASASPFAAMSGASANGGATPSDSAQPSAAASVVGSLPATYKPVSPNDSATSAEPMPATPPLPAGGTATVDAARRTSSQLSTQAEPLLSCCIIELVV